MLRDAPAALLSTSGFHLAQPLSAHAEEARSAVAKGGRLFQRAAEPAPRVTLAFATSVRNHPHVLSVRVMCAFCAVFSGGPHWTEAGTDAARSAAAASVRDRYLDRRHRVHIVNRILAHYGCALEDWAGSKYLVRSRRGQTAVIDTLPQIWAAVEGIAKKPADPLDPDLIAALRQRPRTQR